MAKRANLTQQAVWRFRVRVKVKLPVDGLGPRDREIYGWLRQHVGEGNFAVTPELWLPFGDAIGVHMDDPEKAAAFVTWCDTVLFAQAKVT